MIFWISIFCMQKWFLLIFYSFECCFWAVDRLYWCCWVGDHRCWCSWAGDRQGMFSLCSSSLCLSLSLSPFFSLPSRALSWSSYAPDPENTHKQYTAQQNTHASRTLFLQQANNIVSVDAPPDWLVQLQQVFYASWCLVMCADKWTSKRATTWRLTKLFQYDRHTIRFFNKEVH